MFDLIFSKAAPNLIAGNIFLDGRYSDTWLKLSEDNKLEIQGGEKPEVEAIFEYVKKKVTKALSTAKCFLIPQSYQKTKIGGDFHYAGTLPMSKNPEGMETDRLGCLPGCSKIHFVDGSVLPHLPAKAHTLTIMANSDRIAGEVYGLS